MRSVELQAGWTVAADDSHGGQNALVGFAPVRFGESLAPGSLGGKQWMTVVRQDPQETYAPLAELVCEGAALRVACACRALGDRA